MLYFHILKFINQLGIREFFFLFLFQPKLCGWQRTRRVYGQASWEKKFAYHWQSLRMLKGLMHCSVWYEYCHKDELANPWVKNYFSNKIKYYEHVVGTIWPENLETDTHCGIHWCYRYKRSRDINDHKSRIEKDRSYFYKPKRKREKESIIEAC